MKTSTIVSMVIGVVFVLALVIGIVRGQLNEIDNVTCWFPEGKKVFKDVSQAHISKHGTYFEHNDIRYTISNAIQCELQGRQRTTE